jgi:hypothetical protein
MKKYMLTGIRLAISPCWRWLPNHFTSHSEQHEDILSDYTYSQLGSF